MIDVHCHILPGVDDGAKSWDVTVEMCRLAKQDGISHIVATPHANDRYPYDRERHTEALEELRRRVSGIEFSLGCDFHASYESVEEAVENPARYAISGTRYLLVEFSDYYMPRQMTEILARLHSAGLATIVTHPERHPVIAQYPDLPEEFVSMGSVLQITADSLRGAWGRAARKTCETLLRKRLAGVIATDAHEDRQRKPVLSKARQAAARIAGEAVADQLVEHNPRAIIDNQDIRAAHLDADERMHA